VRKTLTILTLLAFAAILALSVSASDDGKVLYEKKCAMCHGKDGVAKKMAANSGNFNDSSWQEANTLETIQKVTAEGKNKMPAYKEKLSAEEIEAVAKYIKTLAAKE
jgi:cytochrome c6